MLPYKSHIVQNILRMLIFSSRLVAHLLQKVKRSFLMKTSILFNTLKMQVLCQMEIHRMAIATETTLTISRRLHKKSLIKQRIRQTLTMRLSKQKNIHSFGLNISWNSSIIRRTKQFLIEAFK